MKKVIILNGPPGVGKDTIAGELYDRCIADEILSFKSPVFDIAQASLGSRGFIEFMNLYNDRDTKENPTDLLGGLSPRKFMIAISETFIKPIFGSDYFGCAMASNINAMHHSRVAVIPDGGFASELVPILRLSGVEVHVIRFRRDGCSFSGDSRKYIEKIDVFLQADGDCNDYHEHDLHLENGDIEGAFRQACKMINE